MHFFILKGGLVFICGTVDGLIKVSGRRHNADDLKATILAVDPIKFVYRGRYGVIIYASRSPAVYKHTNVYCVSKIISRL